LIDSNASEDAHDGGQDQHQPEHHTGKVDGEHSVQDDEDTGILISQPEEQKN
jgi:hypothetical protein